MEKMTILVLGGYGGTGRLFCRYLLKETDVHVIVAGRRIEKARELADKLQMEFPAERVMARHVDASDKESLRQAFSGIDFVLVAATTTRWAKQIAETAIEAGIDYLDIYFQQSAYPEIRTLAERIRENDRCFITQAGFHPGLPAAIIRKGAQYFDRYDKAKIAFAMNARIEYADSVHELIDEFVDYNPEFFQNGKWQLATYKDAIKVYYGERFGVRDSMPIDMVEIRSLPEQFGLHDTGVFAGGFNWFIDYVFFPFLMLSQKIKRGSLKNFWAKVFIFGINTFSCKQEGVVFVLLAEGLKNGQPLNVKLILEHDSAYDFTVIPVLAMLKQYLDGSKRKPGLWMMGHLADPDRLLVDMEKMGVKIQSGSQTPVISPHRTQRT